MRRALAVAALVLVLGAWGPCAPPINGGGQVATTDTEPWVYVGSGGGAPPFENDWENSAGDMMLAFRIREAGVVDIHGMVSGGTGFTVFTLPEGYRPSSDTTPMVAWDTGDIATNVQVLANGSVRTPFSGASKVSFAHQVFLDLPEIAS